MSCSSVRRPPSSGSALLASAFAYKTASFFAFSPVFLDFANISVTLFSSALTFASGVRALAALIELVAAALASSSNPSIFVL